MTRFKGKNEAMRWIGAFVIILVQFLFAADDAPITVTGEISDSQCAFNVHSNTNSHDDALKSGVLGRTPEACVRVCVGMGGQFVVVDALNKKVYHVANPEKVAGFAGKRVRIRGECDKRSVLSVTTIETR